MLEKFLPVLAGSLEAKGLLPNQIESDRPEPFPEVGACLEVHDVVMSKNEGFMGYLIDQVWDREFHRDESAQARAVGTEEFFEGTEVSVLHLLYQILFCEFALHYSLSISAVVHFVTPVFPMRHPGPNGSVSIRDRAS